MMIAPTWQMTIMAPIFIGAMGLLLLSTVPSAPSSAQDLTYNLGIYQGLSAPERTFARYTVQRTLETKLKHQTGKWDDPLNGTLGLVTPLRSYKSTTGHYCREFMEVVTRKGVVRSALQKACRTPRGRWLRVQPIT